MGPTAKILFPLPSRDYDPSEVAVSWRVLTDLGHRITFATPDAQPPQCDPIMLSGRGLDPWSAIPLLGRLKALGLILRANRAARLAHAAMIKSAEYSTPIAWAAAAATDFDAILLGGGHRARGMREYLESGILQELVATFFAVDKPVAAICHGVLLAARSKDASGRSVLHGRRTTALTWQLERTASRLAHLGRPWDRNYYRTYPEQRGQPYGFMSVEAEVSRALQHSTAFLDVPKNHPLRFRKTSGLVRDTLADQTPAWVVRDRRYVSARWPGDAHTFAKTFAAVLDEGLTAASTGGFS